MFLYILLVFVVLVLFSISYFKPNTEKIISLSLLFVMVLIGGFRDRIGADYYNYMNWFHKGNRTDGLEIGFLAIIRFFKYLNLDYTFLFFFFSFFTYLFAYLGVRKYTKRSSAPLVLYFLVPVFFLYSFTYIRQFLSVTIAFYAFGFLLEKRYWHYFLLMLLGISIHYSCLIPCVVFLLIYKWGEFLKTRYLYLLMGISFIISQIGIINLLSFFFKDSHYLFYVSHKFAVPVPLMKIILLNCMGVIVLRYFDKYGFNLPHQKYLLTAYIFSIIIINAFSESTELTRLYIYFRIFEILLVSEILHSALIKKKILLISFISCFYILPFFRAIKIDYENPTKNFKYIPYRTLLFKSVFNE